MYKADYSNWSSSKFHLKFEEKRSTLNLSVYQLERNQLKRNLEHKEYKRFIKAKRSMNTFFVKYSHFLER